MHFKKAFLVILGVIICTFVAGCGTSTKGTYKEDIQSNTIENAKTMEMPTTNNVEKKTSNKLNLIVDIKQISNKSEMEVNKVLGKPDSTRKEKWHYYDTDEEAKNCYSNIYKQGLIEIFFIEGISASPSFVFPIPISCVSGRFL